MLRCPHETVSLWRAKFLQSLRKYLSDISTDNSIQSALLHSLESWLSPTTAPPYTPPPHLIPLLNSQSRIGWQEMFRGYFAVQWNDHQDDTTGNWSGLVIVNIWSSVLELWELRNNARHSLLVHHQQSTLRRRTEMEIQQLYDKESLILGKDRFIFNTPLREQLERPTHSLRRWIATFGPAIRASAQFAKTSALQHVKSITHYFPKISKQS